MSTTKLKNLFRQFTGCTITEYILSKKTDYASHLLADSDLSIEELAKKVGFDTVSGFSTSFKKQMGIPPSEYRRQIEFNCLKNPKLKIWYSKVAILKTHSDLYIDKKLECCGFS